MWLGLQATDNDAGMLTSLLQEELHINNQCNKDFLFIMQL